MFDQSDVGSKLLTTLAQHNDVPSSRVQKFLLKLKKKVQTDKFVFMELTFVTNKQDKSNGYSTCLMKAEIPCSTYRTYSM